MPYPIEALYADVVQVWHSGHGLFGSGHLIGQNLVLTARHVVTPQGGAVPEKQGWQVGLQAGASKTREVEKWTWIGATVVWCGQETLDLALLELDSQAGIYEPKLKLRIGRIDRVQHHLVRGLGFPRGAKVDERRMLLVPSGTLDDESGPTLGFGVDQQYHPDSPEDDWRGFSGAAVVLEESPDPEVVWLYGVAQQVPQSFTSRLDVARLANAWEDEGFRDILKAAGVPVEPPADPTILFAQSQSDQLVIHQITDVSTNEDDVWSALDLYDTRLPCAERYDVDVFFDLIKHHLAGEFGPHRPSAYWKAYLFVAKYRKEVVGMLLGYQYDDSRLNFLYIPYLVAWEPPKKQRNPVDISRMLVRELARVQRESEDKERPARFLCEIDDPSKASDPVEERTRRARIELFSKIAAFANVQLRCLDFKFLQPKLEPWSKEQETQVLLLYGVEHPPSRLSKSELLDIITWFYTQLYAANISDDPVEGQKYERYLNELLQKTTETLPDGVRLLRLHEL